MNKNVRTLTRKLIFLSVFFALLSFSFGQPNIDPVQGEKELEVMKSVISTSLALVKKSLRDEEGDEIRFSRYRWDSKDFNSDVIEGFYLHGQGVVFTIPYPCLSGRFPGNWENEIDIRLDEIMEEELVDSEFLKQEVELILNEVELQRQELGLSHTVQPPPPPPGVPEAPEAPESPDPAAEMEAAEAAKNLEKQVSKIKVRLREVKEQTEEQKEKAAKERETIKKELIEVVAVHGGSLTQVRENEFINLILKDNCEPFSWDGSGDARTVLSIKKSDLSAYRSGQLTLDQLKSSFVEY
jgi:hypothetical protein